MALRLALVIFALWILVVEPTFRAFELMEESSFDCQHTDQSKDCCDGDQPIPPSEIVQPSWVNKHLHSTLAAAILLTGDDEARSQNCTARFLPFKSLSSHSRLPYPPSALPLRL